MYSFRKAIPIWGEDLADLYNQFLGFHCQIQTASSEKLKIAIAARNYYRLYVNGTMVCSGPARTAKHYCRVDEIEITVDGITDIAIEVAALSTPDRYCNDCTMESGILAAEILNEAGTVLAFTGDANWHYQVLDYRESFTEMMSHSRTIHEVYYLNVESFQWRYGRGEFKTPAVSSEKITYLKRRSPYPTYHKIPFQTLLSVCDMMPIENAEKDPAFDLVRSVNPKWYQLLSDEKCFLQTLLGEKEVFFTGTYNKKYDSENMVWEVEASSGNNPAAFIWETEKSELGFIDFTVTTQKTCVLDVINSDCLEKEGTLKSNSYMTRYHLEPGKYHLTSFEPKLARYIKMIFRTSGAVTFTSPRLLNDTYPDSGDCFFRCSDGDLNRIYDAARRTLRLNTLDIFMDCPQRERGGWLCDSYFTASGAWQMFGDLSVEKDFIENFMLTDADQMRNAFFPEVYPNSKTDPSDPGILNWSFWLIAEFADYYERSGDFEFAECCQERISRFIEGMLSMRGESGLIEQEGVMFVDWSLSNRNFCVSPISVPCNCLAVYILEKMAELYRNAEWKREADKMREIIETIDASANSFSGHGDSAQLKNGKLERGECQTESGIALELWSGFHKADKEYIRRFVEMMGPCPAFYADPNIGKANLFIGLMIRFDVLAKIDEIDTLVREWKSLYLPQLANGDGTLFEGVTESAGCHGFNAATGALMTNKVLGLGQPLQQKKTVILEPHPMHLTWASGTAQCMDGPISLRWSANHYEHVLEMSLQLPPNWKYQLKLPFELSGWTVRLNNEVVSK